MAKIIQFPFEEQREWHRIEKRLKDLLQQVQAWFEGIWSKYREKFRVELQLKLENVPSSTAEVCKQGIETAVRETIVQMRDVSYELFGELISMKVKLEMLRYRHDI